MDNGCIEVDNMLLFGLVFGRYLDAKSCEFLLQFFRSAIAAVGEEKKFFLLLLEEVDEFQGAVQQLISVVEHAVH